MLWDFEATVSKWRTCCATELNPTDLNKSLWRWFDVSHKLRETKHAYPYPSILNPNDSYPYPLDYSISYNACEAQWNNPSCPHPRTIPGSSLYHTAALINDLLNLTESSRSVSRALSNLCQVVGKVTLSSAGASSHTRFLFRFPDPSCGPSSLRLQVKSIS